MATSLKGSPRLLLRLLKISLVLPLKLKLRVKVQLNEVNIYLFTVQATPDKQMTINIVI